MSSTDRSSRRTALILLGVLIVVACLVGVGLKAWPQFDPFVFQRPANASARTLLDKARQRPLSDEEFEAVVALLELQEQNARLMGIATLQLEARRSSERKAQVVAGLTKYRDAPDPAFRDAVRQALERLDRFYGPFGMPKSERLSSPRFSTPFVRGLRACHVFRHS